jgi:23S rRNA (guanosine2251-2'-O)-methyltransferase
VSVASTRMKKRGHRELVVFGRRAVLEALAQIEEDVEVDEVWAARELAPTFRKEIERACRERGLDLRLVRAREVQEISGAPKHDQGVVARVRLGRLRDLQAFVEGRKGKAARRPAALIALDGITNSQNIGMIIRTAVASGISGIVWPMIGTPWVNGLVLKSSASALYRCDVLRCETLVEGLHCLRGAGFEIAGLARPGAENLFEYEVPHRVVFVAGSERDGLSREVEELLDRRLEIPIAGGVESLNVAVAVSFACYKAARMLD